MSMVRPEHTTVIGHGKMALITLVLLGVVWGIDYITGPSVDLSIAYFLPIIYCAWALGRNIAVVVALIAEVPTFIEQMTLMRLQEVTLLAGGSTIIARFLVYLFVAEVTSRLARRSDDLRRLNEELQNTYARLDEDVRAAGVLQAGVLSLDSLKIPGIDVGAAVHYAGPMGGDFVDVGVVDGRLYICIADIAGKGTPAALFTTLLKHLLRDAVHRELSPSQLVANLNTSLCQRLPEDKFVTLFYAEADPATGRISYVNAGHLDGLVFRQSQVAVEYAGRTAPVLGIYDTSSDILTGIFYLDDGDSLFVYTDGLTESRTVDGGRLGDNAVLEIVRERVHLGAQEIVERTLNLLESIAKENERDDMTAVCVKRTRTANGLR